MKPLPKYLLIVFVAAGLFIACVNWTDPPKPVILIDAAAPIAPPETSTLVCIRLLPPMNGDRSGISHT